jgi:hypothetical protein
VQLLVPPSGFTLHRDSDSEGDGLESASAGGALALAGFDHRFFSFGAGFGVTRVLPKTNDAWSDPVITSPASAGFTLALHCRFGALDGLYVGSEIGITTLVDSSQLSHLEVRAQIPFTQKLALLLRGGSGFRVTGTVYVEAAARMRVRGDGGAGTLFVSPFLGYARLSERAVWDDNDNDGDFDSIWSATDERGGPSAGVTVEYRL